MTSQLLADLEWRGLIAQTTDREELTKDLNSKPLKFYIGFDPTAPSLHVGNLVVILVMRRFQLAGHLPIALVGGATGLVGDPSGRNEERTLNDESVVEQWVGNIRSQLEIFLDFNSGKNAAVMANNLDWTKPVSALEFLRDIGKHFSVNQMLAKDSVSSRLESGGISYTEFSYQVLQAFDYLELYRRDNCRLQLGGSDQWGNIVTGLDLIRKVRRLMFVHLAHLNLPDRIKLTRQLQLLRIDQRHERVKLFPWLILVVLHEHLDLFLRFQLISRSQNDP